MAKLVYWIAPLYNDPTYSLVGKTKKAVLEQINAMEEKYRSDYEPIEKRVIYYKDAFDLFDHVSGEDGGRFAGALEKSRKA
jgi:hypothetical protein